MKLIRPSFEIIEDAYPINKKMDYSPLTLNSAIRDNIYKHIEIAGRTCYKSEDKITPDSAKEFVDRMIKSGHGAMLEHGTVYLKLSDGLVRGIQQTCDEVFYKYKLNPYSRYTTSKIKYENETIITGYVTTNLRVLVENNWLDDLQYLCEPTEYHERRVTVRFICDRVTGESFLRHRAIDEDHLTVEGEVTKEMEKDIDSFARESTRFCNYSKDKFNGEFTIITPPEFYDDNIESDVDDWGNNDESVFRKMCNFIGEEQDSIFNIFDTWYFANLATQWSYNRLIALGWKAEQARRIIPLDIKSELVMTAFVSDWQHFFNLRCAPSAHSQARELAIPLKEEFINRKYILN